MEGKIVSIQISLSTHATNLLFLSSIPISLLHVSPDLGFTSLGEIWTRKRLPLWLPCVWKWLPNIRMRELVPISLKIMLQRCNCLSLSPPFFFGLGSWLLSCFPVPSSPKPFESNPRNTIPICNALLCTDYGQNSRNYCLMRAKPFISAQIHTRDGSVGNLRLRA